LREKKDHDEKKEKIVKIKRRNDENDVGGNY